MTSWKIAAVQMDCLLGNKPRNLEVLQAKLREAATRGARLVTFPECALSGYCFESKEEAWPHAEALPGPSTAALAEVCRALKIWAAVGMLERSGEDLFNACALIG